MVLYAQWRMLCRQILEPWLRPVEIEISCSQVLVLVLFTLTGSMLHWPPLLEVQCMPAKSVRGLVSINRTGRSALLSVQNVNVTASSLLTILPMT